MMQVIRAHERHFTDFGWLQTYWLFSFSEYYDPANIQFGALRVFNDDVVTFHTDATLYLGSLEAQRSVTHDTNGTRRVFVYLTEGELAVDGARLYTKDQGRIDTETPLTLTAHRDTRFVLIDVPLSCRGWGYDQATLRGAQG